jgi:calcineurin-like phosphoesterase family protein
LGVFDVSLRHPERNGKRAHRLFKQYKNDIREFEDLELEEAALLLIHYPWLVPCEECGGS